jgi:hypothetical protein
MIPVSRIATCTLGAPVEYFHARSADTPGTCPSGLRPARVFCAMWRCTCGSLGSWYSAVACDPFGAKPKRSNCWPKVFVHVGPCSSSGSQRSKSGSFGVLVRTLSLGSLPGNAASAGAVTPSRMISATSGARPILAKLVFPLADSRSPP